jgi:hypothetical protein
MMKGERAGKMKSVDGDSRLVLKELLGGKRSA